jgi:uncharacterized protein YkwD
LQKYAVAFLAVPVLVTVYLVAVLRRSRVARVGSALVLGGVVALGVIAVARPPSTVATPPTEIVPLTQAAFTSTVETGVAVDTPMTIVFSSPMAQASVASAITVEPATPVQLGWDATSTTLTVTPAGAWAPGAYHTVTIQPGALAENGRPLTRPVRAVFLTRSPSAVALTAGAPIGKRVATDTSFDLTFDRPIDPSSLATGVQLDPPVPLRLIAKTAVDGHDRYTFKPTELLASDTAYRLVVDGVRDADDLELGMTTLEVRTVVAPAVVRFRPRADSTGVDRASAISVRFSKAMDRDSTRAAFSLRIGDKPVAGKISFAEGDTVLIFQPDAKLPYSAKVVAAVAVSATSAQGTPLAEAGRATFKTEAKPAPKPKPATSSSGSGGSSGGSGGGSVGSGSWTSVEKYYLGLMNCTRTGGWVTSTGSCSSPGGRNVAALSLSSGISSKVARPYAKLLATSNQCSHFIGGNPGDRLRRAGYTNYTWAENIGCRSGGAKAAVLATHLFFQSEKSTNGGHYVNMMNSKYDRVGIGVWVSSGRVRLVVDFYHP